MKHAYFAYGSRACAAVDEALDSLADRYQWANEGFGDDFVEDDLCLYADGEANCSSCANALLNIAIEKLDEVTRGERSPHLPFAVALFHAHLFDGLDLDKVARINDGTADVYVLASVPTAADIPTVLRGLVFEDNTDDDFAVSRCRTTQPTTNGN